MKQNIREYKYLMQKRKTNNETQKSNIVLKVKGGRISRKG